MSNQTYYIKGMHCASCELLIEKKLLEQKNVKAVDASTDKNEVVVEYAGEKLNLKEINKIFAGDGYRFADEPFIRSDGDAGSAWIVPVIIAIVFIFLFLKLDKLGLASVINISSNSSLPTFFIFGLIAGVSSCAALIGGLVLSLAKQWEQKYTPHLWFNFGRIISYSLGGAVLGLIGSALSLSGNIAGVLVLAVSVVMAILALQMLGVKAFSGFRFALPKSVTHQIASGGTSRNRYAPFVVGFLTFFLPCGFTIITQGAAVLSGSPVRGGLIMVAFAIGTFVPLFIIGLSSAKFLSNKKWSEGFQKTAGLLVLFFVLFNLNLQFNFLNRSQGDTLPVSTLGEGVTLAATVLKTTYTNRGDIQPNTFTVKRGQPVRMEVEVQDNGYGCMSTIMIPGLYNRAQYLERGSTLLMEFTPEKVGNYRITCAMGVPRGVLTVTD